jgi:methylmalonyl-CoA/ethylmalonyl-CoA epimerase
MFEKYTEAARRVIFYARYEASETRSDVIGAEHLLLGLLHDNAESLSRLLPPGMTVGEVRRRVAAAAAGREKLGVSVELPLSAEAKKALAFAHEEAELLSHRHIGPEHLALGLLRVEGSLAETILREHGVGLVGLREKLSGASPDSSTAAESGGAKTKLSTFRLEHTGLRIEHIGIATRSIEEALGFWRDALGLEVRHTETVEEQGVNVAMLPAGEPRIELLEPTGPDSPVAKFLEKRGPGIHHVAVRVPDIRAALSRLKAEGARLIDEEPRNGAGGCLVAFIHPASAGGVLLELVEHASGAEPDVQHER